MHMRAFAAAATAVLALAGCQARPQLGAFSLAQDIGPVPAQGIRQL